SDVARALSTATLVLVVAVTGWLLRPAPSDLLARAAQIGAVGVAMLLVPVFTYEHHLVWALPAVVATAVAVHAGRLTPAWAVALGLAWTAWAYDLAALKELSNWLGHVGLPALGWVLQEVKTAALLVLWAACVRL